MFTNLLQIPFRICDTIPLYDVLSEIIRKDYFQPVSSFENDLKNAQRLQNDIAVLSREKDIDIERFEQTLYQYYHLLSDLSNKFMDNSVSFEWYGTLRYQPKHCSFSSWKQEQLQLIYEMGCLKSYHALNGNAYTDEGLKLACQSLKVGAGYFDVLLKMDPQIRAELPDFDEDTLQCLKGMLIAQAQELVWLKAAMGNTVKDHIIARLSIKVSELYDKAAFYASESDSITLDWINHFKVKKFHFEAAAHYRMSMVAIDSFRYGDQVAHLKVASKVCDEGLKYKSYVDKSVIEDLQGLTEVVKSTLKGAEKDNDLVYLKPVPNARELPAIAGVSMVEILCPESFFQRPLGIEAFKALVPFSIIQIAQAFRERQDAFIVDHFHEPLGALTRMFSKFLAERDLPASIDSIQKPESIPDSLLQHSLEIISIGGTKLIENSMLEIGKLGKQCQDLVEACEERLTMERYEDRLMRERQGTNRWNREMSETAAAAFSSRVSKMNTYLEQGLQSDSLIMNLYNSIKDILLIYCGGNRALLSTIPKSSRAHVDTKVGQVIGELRELLTAADKLEQSKQRTISSVNIKSRDHSVFPVVMGQYKKNPQRFLDDEGKVSSRKFEAVYESHIKAFETDIKHVDQIKQKQIDLEKKIHEKNLQLIEVKKALEDSSQINCHQALQSFEEAYVQYLELVSNLNQASRFYSDFLEKGNALLHEIDQFLYSRREEARELLINIENQDKLRKIEDSMQNNRVPLAAPQSQRAISRDPTEDMHLP